MQPNITDNNVDEQQAGAKLSAERSRIVRTSEVKSSQGDCEEMNSRCFCRCLSLFLALLLAPSMQRSIADSFLCKLRSLTPDLYCMLIPWHIRISIQPLASGFLIDYTTRPLKLSHLKLTLDSGNGNGNANGNLTRPLQLERCRN